MRYTRGAAALALCLALLGCDRHPKGAASEPAESSGGLTQEVAQQAINAELSKHQPSVLFALDPMNSRERIHQWVAQGKGLPDNTSYQCQNYDYMVGFINGQAQTSTSASKWINYLISQGEADHEVIDATNEYGQPRHENCPYLLARGKNDNRLVYQGGWYTVRMRLGEPKVASVTAFNSYTASVPGFGTLPATYVQFTVDPGPLWTGVTVRPGASSGTAHLYVRPDNQQVTILDITFPNTYVVADPSN